MSLISGVRTGQFGIQTASVLISSILEQKL